MNIGDSVQNYKLLVACLEPQRAGYTALVQKQLKDSVQYLQKLLIEADGDAEKAAPYPNSFKLNRFEYSSAKFKYSGVREWSRIDTTKPRRYGMHDPEWRVAKCAFVVDELTHDEADEITTNDFHAFAAKLSKKILQHAAIGDLTKKILPLATIGAHITRAVITGPLWTGSVLRVTLSDGSEQSWSTRMILNRSVLGKLFNQWPTHRIG